MLIYNGVKDFLMGNNNDFFDKTKWREWSIFMSPTQMIAEMADVLNASL